MSKLTIGEKIVNFVIGAAYAILMVGVSTSVFLLIFDESEYKVGDCIAIDQPRWIKQSPIFKIADKDRDSYRIEEVGALNIAENSITIRNTISNEFQATYVSDENIEGQKVFNKVKVVDCPK